MKKIFLLFIFFQQLFALTKVSLLAAKAQEHTDSITTDATSCNMHHSSGEFRSDGQGDLLFYPQNLYCNLR